MLEIEFWQQEIDQSLSFCLDNKDNMCSEMPFEDRIKASIDNMLIIYLEFSLISS